VGHCAARARSQKRRTQPTATCTPPRQSPESQRLATLLPDIDPGVLDLILPSLARPFATGRRLLLREIEPGVRIF